MKVVVYFRQAGGIAVKDYPTNTHWTEDENEVPVPLFSTFEIDAANALPPEVRVQIEAVNPWLEARRGIVVATFTEIEDGSLRRPNYGAARKAAGHYRAVLLVATTKAITGVAFDPASQDGVTVVTLQDTEKITRDRWARSADVVVYLRFGPDEEQSDILLAKQRRELSKMTPSVNILAEFTEQETAGSFDRPELAKALELCRKHKARLFIGTTDAMGDDGEFRPDFTDVPYEVAYRQDYDWPDLIPLVSCPYPVALFFGKQVVRGNIPLYLANNTGSHLLDVDIVSRGSTYAGGELAETTPGSKSPGCIPTGQARLVEAYDVYFDGDFLTEYQISARMPDGTRFAGRAIVKEIPASRWVKVDAQQPVAINFPR